MTDERRSLLKAVGVYLSTAALLMGATYMVLAGVIVNLQVASEIQPREPTRLQEVVETAREIRRTLATPIPPPPPLPPITAEVQRSRNSVSARSVVRPQRRSLPREAADSYARQPAQDFSAGRAPEIYDRHAVR